MIKSVSIVTYEDQYFDDYGNETTYGSTNVLGVFENKTLAERFIENELEVWLMEEHDFFGNNNDGLFILRTRQRDTYPTFLQKQWNKYNIKKYTIQHAGELKNARKLNLMRKERFAQQTLNEMHEVINND